VRETRTTARGVGNDLAAMQSSSGLLPVRTNQVTTADSVL
jgi:hypothetical protein